MTKEEFEAKLHNCEERLEDVTKSIKEAGERLAKLVEKPKLRHGDFGLDDELYVVVSQKTLLGSPKAIFASTAGLINADESMSSDTCFGNIFDLMKGWGEPFENITLKSSYEDRKFLIQTSLLTTRDIYLGVEERGKRMGVYLTKAEAYKIWCKLGHALMELKRKENKCS